jgi:D-alanine-D-alanine ligase
VADKIPAVCKRVYRSLQLSGYARIDMRADAQGRVWVIEANPNPQIASGEDFAQSALSAKVSYPMLIQRILTAGLRWEPEKNG